MSLAQLVPSIPVASSNLIVSADAGEQAATIERPSMIDRIWFMGSFRMKQAPRVKPSGKENFRCRDGSASKRVAADALA
jgi:hypothetical protein